MCIGNRVNLQLFLKILTIFLDEKSWFYQIMFNCVEFKLPFTWALATWGSCVAGLRSSTPEIYSHSVHLYSGVAQSTVCVISPAMFN